MSIPIGTPHGTVIYVHCNDMAMARTFLAATQLYVVYQTSERGDVTYSVQQECFLDEIEAWQELGVKTAELVGRFGERAASAFAMVKKLREKANGNK